MPHRYVTRYQSNIAQNLSVSNEDNMSDEEVRQESTYHHEQQESLFASLIPHEMKKAVNMIVVDHENDKLFLTYAEKKEADKIYKMIDDITSDQYKIKLMTYHYPIISRLHAIIELFTYMKHNYELVKQFNHLANIFHDYYGHFTVLHSTLWNECNNPSSHSYKDIYLPYCTLLSAIKDIIHKTELIYIKEGILKYY
jgi:hypothetical protein